MLSVTPIPEGKESAEITPIYTGIKKALQTETVPLIFQYLAPFPVYLRYIWEQVKKNIDDPFFGQNAQSLVQFSDDAIQEIYTPSAKTRFTIESIPTSIERDQIRVATQNLQRVTSILYLISIAIRESLKGVNLGIKQIGSRVSNREKVLFEEISNDFIPQERLQKNRPSTELEKSHPFLATSNFAKFLKAIEEEMQKLLKQEEYLHRRVALEKFALSRLILLREPIDSSFKTVSQKASSEEGFSELLYILSELFPTQTPHKLLTSSVMIQALRNQNQKSQPFSGIPLPPPK
ncbi:hypothetical protein HYW55_06045 [Candidatus Gottesmanbacteria bacterium]|nr:hypothetical protein [Candidatus Gottesmanbacteria bacterium]